MADDDRRDARSPITRLRREPPPFRRVEVRRLIERTPRLRRVVLGGPELHGFTVDQPASSIRLLLPPTGADEIVMPTWTGNQFELPAGERAPIRTFTPVEPNPERLELSIDVVLHDSGAATDWVRSARPGDVVAVSGPGRGDDVDAGASSYLLAGDETAIPAIDQLLETIPASTRVDVHVEVTDPAARLDLHPHPNATVTWHTARADDPPGSAMAAAVEALDDLPDALWVAGEAAAVQRLRRYLFDERGLPRSRVTARGYWKQGRSAT